MIRPLSDRVLVEPKEAETKTAAGIYIPDTAKEKPQQGTVLAAGPDGSRDLYSGHSKGKTAAGNSSRSRSWKEG